MSKKQLASTFLLTFLMLEPSAPLALGQAARQGAVTPQELRLVADGLYQRGRFNEARRVYLKIHPQFAKDPELNRNLGWCFSKGRRPDLLRAIHYWSLSWNVEENEALRMEAARAYVRLGRWEDGAKLLRNLAERHAYHPQHWKQLAELAMAAKRNQQAIVWYQSYLERRPGDVQARLQRARVLSWEKKFNDALTEYNIVLQTNPRNISARVGIAMVLSWQGQLAESLKSFNAILAAHPRNREALTGKAFVLLWTGGHEDAKPIFQTLARRFRRDQEVRGALKKIARLEAAEAEGAAPPRVPTDPVVALQIQEAFSQGDGARAVSLLQEALKLSPDNLQLQRRLAQAYLLADQFDAAISLLQDLRSKQPDNTEVLRELASAQSRAGKLSEAANTLHAYVQKNPEDRAARLQLARTLSWSRRFEEATATYQEILSEDPDNLESLIGLARIKSWQGWFTAALKQFEAILRKHPQQRDALIGKGQALYWSGKTEEAFQFLGQLQEKLPEDSEVASVLESFRDAERKRATERAAVPPDVDTLIRSYQDILNRNPRDFEGLRMMGELYGRKNNFKEAVVYYRRAHQERPQDRQVQHTLARFLSWDRQNNEAVQLYRDLVRKDPDLTYQLELAKVLSWDGRHNESEAVYERVLELQPEQIEARLGMARVQSRKRNFDQSLHNYQLVLERQPIPTTCISCLTPVPSTSALLRGFAVMSGVLSSNQRFPSTASLRDANWCLDPARG